MRTFFLVVVALLLSVEALACSCDVGTIDEQFENATAAFRIRVTGTELKPTSELDLAGVVEEEEISEDEIAEFLEEMPEYVRVSFEVIEVFKGASNIPEYLNQMTFSPGNCGLVLMTGTEYVIFLTGDPLEFATFCTGSFGFFDAEGTEVKPDLIRLRELAK